MKIKSKLLIFVFITIVLVASSVVTSAIFALKDSTEHHIEYYTKAAYKNKEMSLRNNVSVAKDTIKSFYEKMQTEGLSEEKAKALALNYIKNVRYSNNNYYWVKDLDAKMLMHPMSPSLNNTNVANVKDVNGKAIFQEMIALAKEKGNGLVEYTWNKPGVQDPQPKYSYVELFQPWGWVIGTGSYLDDVENDVKLMRHNSEENLNGIIIDTLLLVLVTAIILSIISSFLIKKIIVGPLSTLTGTVKALTKFSSADQKININSKDEIGDLARYFNEYLESIRQVVSQDQQIVEESEKAIEMVRAGFFSYKVESTSQNRSTNDLKNAINDLIDDLNQKFTEVNKCIMEYGKSNFEYDFQVDNIAGQMGTLVTGTKSVGYNVSEL
ncbi:MAG: methyl-accepting chemotaxis protein, partial [Arcobacteraceae bacterium]